MAAMRCESYGVLSGAACRTISFLAFSLALVTTPACERGIANPAAPSSLAAPAAGGAAGFMAKSGAPSVDAVGVSKVDVCHRTEGARGFIPITVALPSVESHIAHGDGLVGDPVPGQTDLRFGPQCVTIPMAATTLTFNGLTVDRAPLTSYAESGFTVTSVSGNWIAFTGYGKPAPSVVFYGSPAMPWPAVTAEVAITKGGSVFTFSTIDLYSSVTRIPWEFTGLRNGTIVFEETGEEGNTYGNFVTVATAHGGEVIDRLVIRLSNPVGPNPMGIDNVVLR
jgi:hypothetical protein